MKVHKFIEWKAFILRLKCDSEKEIFHMLSSTFLSNSILLIFFFLFTTNFSIGLRSSVQLFNMVDQEIVPFSRNWTQKKSSLFRIVQSTVHFHRFFYSVLFICAAICDDDYVPQPKKNKKWNARKWKWNERTKWKKKKWKINYQCAYIFLSVVI